MKKTTPTKTEQVLQLDYTNTDQPWLSSQETLRRLIGILGVMLPFLLWFFLYVDTGYKKPMESISHYYFTRACSIMVIVVSLLAIFLLIYKGYRPVDFWVSKIAGIFALGLVLFPTGNISIICQDPDSVYSVTILKDSPFRVAFHYISATLFLSSLAFMSLFLFTKSNKPPEKRTRNKWIRNRIYRICGVIMILAILVIAAGLFGIIPEEIYFKNRLTFWMETVAVESFGVAWLLKGKVGIKD